MRKRLMFPTIAKNRVTLIPWLQSQSLSSHFGEKRGNRNLGVKVVYLWPQGELLTRTRQLTP